MSDHPAGPAAMVKTLGWPATTLESFTEHANVKLTSQQLAYIEASGESTSQWIREAVEKRIEEETT